MPGVPKGRELAARSCRSVGVILWQNSSEIILLTCYSVKVPPVMPSGAGGRDFLPGLYLLLGEFWGQSIFQLTKQLFQPVTFSGPPGCHMWRQGCLGSFQVDAPCLGVPLWCQYTDLILKIKDFCSR